MREDDAAVLRALIGSLPVDLRRVVHRPEDLEELIEGDDLGIERHLDDFGVTGRVTADLPVRGVLDDPAAVAGDGVDHAGDLAEQVLDAPEAAGAEGRGLRWHVMSFPEESVISIVPSAGQSVA